MKLFAKMLTIAAIIIATTAFADEPADNAPTETGFSAEQVQAIQSIVEERLNQQPQLVVNALIKYKQQEMSKRELQTQSAIKENADSVFSSDLSCSFGKKDASVKIVEFMDYRCAHCKNMAPVLQDVLAKTDNVEVIVKQLPIFGGASLIAAKAALAARNQNKCQAFHEALFEAKDPLDKKTIFLIAKKLSLNVAKLKKDMESEEVEASIKANFELSQKLRILGTPAFIVGNESLDKIFFIPGATDKTRLLELVKQASS
jgi:protein-disulfide isomerase